MSSLLTAALLPEAPEAPRPDGVRSMAEVLAEFWADFEASDRRRDAGTNPPAAQPTAPTAKPR